MHILQMANSLFENNADIESDLSPATPVVLCPGFEYPVEGAYDTILYLSKYGTCAAIEFQMSDMS